MSSNDSVIRAYMAHKRRLIDSNIKRYFPYKRYGRALIDAIRYSLAGGKRLRPVLVFLGAKACAGRWQRMIPAACAVEMIHVYSLIHDDLPAMDDDDLRRGRATCHKKFSDAIAILAGDALLTRAFEVMASYKEEKISDRAAVLEAIYQLAHASGVDGMVGGQAEDINISARYDRNSADLHKKLGYIHMNKTAALIKASVLTGALLSGASRKETSILSDFGEKIGLAFQITDDILDVIGDPAVTGKAASDERNKKLTYPSLYGIDRSCKYAAELTNQAKDRISFLGKKGALLGSLAEYISKRTK